MADRFPPPPMVASQVSKTGPRPLNHHQQQHRGIGQDGPRWRVRCAWHLGSNGAWVKAAVPISCLCFIGAGPTGCRPP